MEQILKLSEHMNALEFEQAVFSLDQIRIVIRAKTGAELKPYKFVRKATDSASLSEWLDQRIMPLVGDHQVVVVDGSGVSPHGRTKIEKIRASYAD
jgi:hypothetical protein